MLVRFVQWIRGIIKDKLSFWLEQDSIQQSWNEVLSVGLTPGAAENGRQDLVHKSGSVLPASRLVIQAESWTLHTV